MKTSNNIPKCIVGNALSVTPFFNLVTNQIRKGRHLLAKISVLYPNGGNRSVTNHGFPTMN